MGSSNIWFDNWTWLGVLYFVVEMTSWKEVASTWFLDIGVVLNHT